MGKRSRARRRSGQGEATGTSSGGAGDAAVIQVALLAAARAVRSGDGVAVDRHLACVGVGDGIAHPDRVATVGRVLERMVERTIEDAWSAGWQPADVAREVRRRRSAGHVGAVITAITAQHRRYAPATVDRVWRNQLRDLGADPWMATVAEPANRLPSGDTGGSGAAASVRTLVEVLAVLAWLPALPRLGPLPGEARCPTSTGEGVDGRVLERVRALLAKAESTTFAEEAEAFTAKAQELMARHSFDRAMLDGARPVGGPGGRRLGIDDPYAQAKSVLLGQVAAANRCRTVWLVDLGFSTVFGHEPDLDAVEVLYTSLLVQAVSAMTAAGSQVDRSGRSRTRSFRTSFLVAFAQRIGQRLRESTAAAQNAGTEEYGDRLLPVLAARDQAVDDAVTAAFPRMVQQSVSISNRAGWAAGTAAADVARLSPNQQVERGRASA